MAWWHESFYRRVGHDGPSSGQRIANVSKAAGRVVRAAVNGERIRAPREVVEARRVICRECPERDKNDVCRECGCALAAKRRLLTEDCPLGKWPVAPSQSPQ